MPACMRSARSRISISRRTGAPTRVRDALNAHLRPHPVAVLAAEKVAGRFRRALLGDGSATISIASSTAAPISRSSAAAPGACRAGSMPTAMHAAAQRLVGKHDFTTFRSTECQAKSPVKTLDRLDVTRDGDEVRDRRRRRARSCTIRCARWSARWCWSATASGAPTISAARSRRATARRCGPVAPPEGLYLVRVDY